jgi:hypothetical protein
MLRRFLIVCSLVTLSAVVHGMQQADPPRKQPVDPKWGWCDVSDSEKAWWCDTCKTTLAKTDLDENKECKKCHKAAREIDVCVKKGFVCDMCSGWSLEKGDCAHCNKPLREKSVKSPVYYRCANPKCSFTSPKSGKCTGCVCPEKMVGKERCDACDKEDLVKSCKDSGAPPHVTKKK